MTIKQQAVQHRPVRSHLNDNILHVSVDVGHAIEELERKRAAVLCDIKNNPMILVRRSDNIVDCFCQELDSQYLVLVTARDARPDGREAHDMTASALGHESTWVQPLGVQGHRLGQVPLQDDYDEGHEEKEREDEQEMLGLVRQYVQPLRSSLVVVG